MMRDKIFLLLLLTLPLAAAAQTSVDITITPNNIVREDVTLRIDADRSYDEVRWDLSGQPLSVVADSAYRIQDGTLILEQGLTPGNNTVSFSVVFDDLVLRDGDSRVLRLALSPASEQLDVSVTLPHQHVLADQAAAIPEPDQLRTDGQNIILSWQRAPPLSLAVTYQAPSSQWGLFFAIIGALAVISGSVFWVWRRQDKRRSREPLRQTLSSNEQQVLDLLRSGVRLQKELVDKTGFSKSKMSKVVRNLELKGAVRKQPHMRTNRLVVDEDWR